MLKAAGLLAAAMCAAVAAHAQSTYLPQDTNFDGYQSRAELVAWYSAHLAALDANKDGLDKRECAVLYPDQVRDGAFARADANKDGKLQGPEIKTMAAIIAAQDMKFCDSDRDGRISNAEERVCTSGETINQ